MKARRTFLLDLRTGPRPRFARGGAAPVLDLPAPSRGAATPRGLRLPTAHGGGLLFWNCGKLNDAAGSLAIEFSLDAGDAGGTLLRTFGNYLTLAASPAGRECELRLRIYGHDLRILARRPAGRPLRVRASWDCARGFRLSAGGVTLARNAAWLPYRQKRVPIEIGGAINELRPGRTKWVEAFRGWIRVVECHARPLETPALDPAEARRIAPLAPPPPTRALAVPRGLSTVDYHDAPIVESPLRFDAIPDRPSNLRACQRAHPELARLYHGARNAFDGLLAVGRHVSNLWPHTSYWPWPRAIFEERGDRLLAGIKRGEVCGMCGGYAHVMEEALWALGVPARRTQVFGHSSFEAYDHAHDKWICLEVDNAVGHAGCWLDARGIPYSIGELIDLLERDRVEPGAFRRSARHLPLGSQCPAGKIHGSDPESWARACYLYMGWFKRRDYGAKAPPESRWHYPRAYRPSRLDPYSPPAGQRLVPDPRLLYWSCDRVRVRLDWRDAPRTVRLHLQPFQAQFFESFEIHVDGRRFALRRPSFAWHLHGGLNRIRVSTRNLLGAVGHPWRLALHR
jgi:hypothetical protein